MEAGVVLGGVALILYAMCSGLNRVENEINKVKWKVGEALVFVVILIMVIAWLGDATHPSGGVGNARAATGAQCTTATVNLRECAGMDCDKIRTLAPGTEVTVDGNNHGWASVSVDGASGWIAARYLDDC